MSNQLEIPVISKNGLRGKVLTPSRLLDISAEKTIIFESGRRVSVPSRHLHLRTNGTYFLNLTVDPSPSNARASDQADEIVIPRIEERAEVSTRTVETGRVRVEKTAYEDPIVVDEPTIYEEYDVRRVPVDREVAEESPTRVEGDTTIVPVYEEEVVTTKRLILREEIHLVKKRREEHAPQKVLLRKESVEVERTSIDRAGTAKG